MSTAETSKSNVISRVIDGIITVRQAADMLGLSERQIKRLKKGVQIEGLAALAHGNRGRKPAHALSDATRSLIIKMAMGLYKGTSCQHMSELLKEQHGVNASAKTITRILHDAKVELHFSKKQSRRRKTRDRMPQEGMLIQIDASIHNWLDHGPKFTLHGGIDDATGKALSLWFRPNEDLEGYLVMLEQLVTNYGSPMSIYSDRHTIFFSPNKDKLTLEEELAGVQAPASQFGRALRELGIKHIPASSPQAKGRIERLWGTLQARLIVELRIAGVTTIDEANAFLLGFMKRFNERFAVEPANPKLAYGVKHNTETLAMSCCSKIERSVSNGSYFSFNSQTHQLVNAKGTVVPLRPKSKVSLLVRENRVRALYDGCIFNLKEIQKPTKQAPQPAPKTSPRQRAPISTPWHNWTVSKPRPHKSVVDRYFDKHDLTWSDYAHTTEIRHRLGDL